MRNITIGIVILNYNSYRDTEILVEELLAKPSVYNLIVQIVDNASKNGSYEYLSNRFANIPNVYVYANNENSGYAKGNNVGLRLLKKIAPSVNYALILNNDVHFDIAILEQLVAAYESIGNVGVMAPMQYDACGKPVKFKSLRLPTFADDFLAYTFTASRVRRDLKFKENTNIPDVCRVDVVQGCFMFIDYALFESIGFFEEDTFLFCEERFVARKLKEIGKASYILLDCSFVHAHSKTINNEVAFLRQLRLLHDGRVAYTRRYRCCASLKIALLDFMWIYQCGRMKFISYMRRLFSSHIKELSVK